MSDIKLKKLLNETIGGVKFLSKYQFNYHARTYRVMHGHQFDTGIVTWRFSMKMDNIFKD